jgi:uncharacterized phage protein (TIGR02218 family)
MKRLQPALAAHLASGITTLAWCWRLVRRDDVSLGFTDHDRDLTFAGVTYEAATGFTTSEIRDTLGLAVDNLDVQAALSSMRLDEDDLAAGLYDDARVEIWRVNWADTAQRVLMRKGSLGEITRAGKSFSAEIRGLAHYLNQPSGRTYQYNCDADLGDTKCGVNLSSSALRGTATVGAVVDQRTIVATGLSAFETEHFSRGLVSFVTGANAGQKTEIRRHTRISTTATIELWQSPAKVVAVGDTLLVTAGCDKHFATCRDRFANSARFRGFPHMPGNEFVTTIARAGDGNDGSALR